MLTTNLAVSAGPPSALIPSGLTLMYRGSLESCNYSCHYCPFAKRKDSRQRLAKDAAEVARFVAWVAAQQRNINVFFTPWGEALVRRHYRQAIAQLAALPQVQQVALQTNLAGPLTWLQTGKMAAEVRAKIALWCTFHPDQTSMSRFLARCATLRDYGVRFSVGVVALQAHFPAIRALRAALPSDCYLWLNAYDRRGAEYYSQDDIQFLESIDPWFAYNRQASASRGKPCRAGAEVLSVDGDGELQRCHFVTQRLGNLYQDALQDMLQERACPRFKCECFIGYAQRRDLPFQAAFGDGVLARIPLVLKP